MNSRARIQRGLGCAWILMALLSHSPPLRAQELERAFCDDSLPGNNCPGDCCVCSDDTLEVVFEGQPEDSVFQYEEFTAGMAVPALVVADVQSDTIRGYSFGVAHDAAFLEITVPALRIDDTASMPARNGGFVARRVVPGGFVLAIVLSFDAPVVLPLERSILVRATYTLVADPGTAGTVLRFTEVLGNPATTVVFTVDLVKFRETGEDDGESCTNGIDEDEDGLTDRDDPECVVHGGFSRKPRKLIDGLVRRRDPAGPAFRRGDCNGDGAVTGSVTDAVYLLNFNFLDGPPPPCLAACDSNGDGAVLGSVTDAVYLLNFNFLDGPPPPLPFPVCEPGTPADRILGCERPPPACSGANGM